MLEIVEDQIAELKKLWKNKRLLLHQGLNLAMIVFSALMIWKGLMFLTKSESPVVVVLSGSMEPAFQRGDILFLNNQANPIRVGEVVVFKIKDRIDPCGNQNFGAPRHKTRSRPRSLTHWLNFPHRRHSHRASRDEGPREGVGRGRAPHERRQ